MQSVLQISLFKTKLRILFLLLLLLPGQAAAGESLTVALAANFALPMEEIAQEFQRESGIRLQTVISSTGRLYAQIKNGAPYDLFFAADELRPQLLFEEGLASEPVVYAGGRVVLWTAKKELCALTTWQEALSGGSVGKIGIANLETAPYGKMAAEAIREIGLWDDVSPRLVYAGNVGQSFQYAAIGSVRLAFVANSHIATVTGKNGCFWQVPQAKTIIQKACIIKRSAKQKPAEELLLFLRSARAQVILAQYGYR